MVIWKFPFEIDDLVRIEMPIGAVVLGLSLQYDKPYLLAMVDPCSPKEIREFVIIGTGNQMPDHVGKYIGSFQMYGGLFVWHVFERAEIYARNQTDHVLLATGA